MDVFRRGTGDEEPAPARATLAIVAEGFLSRLSFGLVGLALNAVIADAGGSKRVASMFSWESSVSRIWRNSPHSDMSGSTMSRITKSGWSAERVSARLFGRPSGTDPDSLLLLNLESIPIPENLHISHNRVTTALRDGDARVAAHR